MGVSLTINGGYVMFCYGLQVGFRNLSPSLEGRFLIIKVKERAKL